MNEHITTEDDFERRVEARLREKYPDKSDKQISRIAKLTISKWVKSGRSGKQVVET